MAIQPSQDNTPLHQNNSLLNGNSKNNEPNDAKNTRAYYIALIVIIAFVGYFGASLFILGIESTKEMTALLGGYVATVLVYFFGKEQSQVLSNQIETTTSDKIKFEEAVKKISSEIKTTSPVFLQTSAAYDQLLQENTQLNQEVLKLTQSLHQLQPLISAVCNDEEDT